MSHTTHFKVGALDVNVIHDGDWSGLVEIALESRGNRQVFEIPGPVLVHLAAHIFASAAVSFGESHAADGAVHFGEQHAADWLVTMIQGTAADKKRVQAPDPVAGCLALGALQKLLDVTDEEDARGEPVLGHDHTGALNWLLDFADKVRPILRPQGRKP